MFLRESDREALEGVLRERLALRCLNAFAAPLGAVEGEVEVEQPLQPAFLLEVEGLVEELVPLFGA